MDRIDLIIGDCLADDDDDDDDDDIEVAAGLFCLHILLPFHSYIKLKNQM